MSTDFRVTFDEAAEWPLWRVLAANDLIEELAKARAFARATVE